MVVVVVVVTGITGFTTLKDTEDGNCLTAAGNASTRGMTTAAAIISAVW
jgi:hypothetical protein